MKRKQNVQFSFKRLWQDYRQIKIGYISYLSMSILILLNNHTYANEKTLFTVSCSLFAVFLFYVCIMQFKLHSKDHAGRDKDNIIMDEESVKLVRENIIRKKIRWEDIVKIEKGLWGLDFGYGLTYLIWDKNGEQIWFHRGKKVKKYMLELYPPIKDMLPGKKSKCVGNDAHID